MTTDNDEIKNIGDEDCQQYILWANKSCYFNYTCERVAHVTMLVVQGIRECISTVPYLGMADQQHNIQIQSHFHLS